MRIRFNIDRNLVIYQGIFCPRKVNHEFYIFLTNEKINNFRLINF